MREPQTIGDLIKRFPFNGLKMDNWKEEDPYGIDAHSPGAKLDANKPRCGLVLGGFSRALRAVVDVGTYGARKYTDKGWESVNDGFNRYTDAQFRHQFDFMEGEELDPESKLYHLAHESWNSLAKLELFLRSKDAANRSPSNSR